MNDLGYKNEPMAVPETKAKNEPKMSYPHLCIRDKSLEAAFGKELPSVGEEVEATVKLKVTGVSHDEWGKRVEFDVVAGDFSEPEETDGSEVEGDD